jgi:spermidine synthase
MSRGRRNLFLTLFFVSGACGLIYEIVWSRLLVLVFGGTTIAITTVVACFMGGLALGSCWAGRKSASIRNPERLYGVLELIIGLYCACVPFIFRFATPIYKTLVETFGASHVSLAVARVSVSAAILLVPTACMGATLPLLSKGFTRQSGLIGADAGRLYGVNTIGAFAGCAGAGFFLLPLVGLQWSVTIAASLNAAAGIAAILLSFGVDEARSNSPKNRKHDAPEPDSAPVGPVLIPRGAVLGLYALSGFAAMAYQIAWTRALILSIGSSTYAFSAIVACFIMGLALGSLFASIWADRIKNLAGAAGLLEAGIALSALAAVPLFAKLPGFVSGIVGQKDVSFAGVMSLELLCVLGLLAAPTLCMGALMPLVCRIVDPACARAGKSVGDVYSSNTAGAIAGAVVTGFILIPAPWIGAQATILFASALNGAIATVFLLAQRDWRRPVVFGMLGALWAAGIAMGVFGGSWPKEAMASGPFLGRALSSFEIVEYIEGADTTVAVTKSGEDNYSLIVNGKADASTALVDRYTQYLSAFIPLSMRPKSTEICIIGLGSGATAAAALSQPVAAVDVAEISGAVIKAARHFTSLNDDILSKDARLNIHRADGRNMLLLGEKKYDIIISEPSNPWIAGMSNLFSREFFQLAKSRLKPGGLHCQWIQGYTISVEEFCSIVRTLASVFPHCTVWEMARNDYLVVGSEWPLAIDLEETFFVFARPRAAEKLASIHLNDPAQLGNHFIASGGNLGPVFACGRILTDDLPYLEFSAPRSLLSARTSDHAIKTMLAELRVTIPLAGGETAINKQFAAAARNAGLFGRKYREIQGISGSRDLDNTLKALIESAVYCQSDARGLLFVVGGFEALASAHRNDAAARDKVRKAAELIAKINRNFLPFRYGRRAPDTLFWPLGRQTDGKAPSLLNNLFENIDSFAQTGQTGQLEEEAMLAVASAPASKIAALEAGRKVLAASGPDQALGFLLKAWIMDTGDSEANYQLARAYGIRGDLDRSAQFLQAARKNGLALPADMETDPAFESLCGNPALRYLFMPTAPGGNE